MDTRDLILPAAVLIGGVVLGRIFGFKPIWRGAMAALALAGAVKDAGLVAAPAVEHRRHTSRREAVTRAVRKRTPHKKSARAA